MIIRRMRETDVDQVRAMVLDLHETLRRLDPELPPGEAIVDDHFAWMQMEVAKTTGAFFVADVDDAICGYICILGIVRPHEPDEGEAAYSFIQELYVSSDARGTGVGARLLKHAEDYADSLGSRDIRLAVIAGNEVGESFYRTARYAPRSTTFRKRIGRQGGDARADEREVSRS